MSEWIIVIGGVLMGWAICSIVGAERFGRHQQVRREIERIETEAAERAELLRLAEETAAKKKAGNRKGA